MNNRKIKFRVWDKDQCEFIDLSCGHHNQKLNDFFNDDLFVFQQFTGIQDKNGNDIYEGDIIEGLHDYGPAGFHLQTAPVFWHNIHGYQWNYWNIHTLEITGNIFQNQPPTTPVILSYA